ncbi:hypothetical protein CAPTEDRAFT_198207 [Capitella teleta]|uniref:Sulfotransferase domain-containing protein n=1 Tax=Capitella teleta TaxID=283909 RepID=X1ZYD9_CAPTE|nr:hypothetical protein CAPTEDRAFT_198207 [Capitella teleta]|eukprot:ELU04744.1 hypothetical protein CAPTEDRAFT_198207 [Capitella teleta]
MEDDGSSFTFWEFDGWENIPLNVGLRQPNVTHVHSLRRLMPNAKIVVLLRNPIERLYSHYCALKRDVINVRDFHERARYGVEKLNHCFHSNGVRQCAFDTKIHEDL